MAAEPVAPPPSAYSWRTAPPGAVLRCPGPSPRGRSGPCGEPVLRAAVRGVLEYRVVSWPGQVRTTVPRNIECRCKCGTVIELRYTAPTPPADVTGRSS